MKTYVSRSSPNGYVALTVQDDLLADEQGDTVKLKVDSFRNWGVSRLLDVTSHQVNRVGSTVSHVVHFVNGGHVAMAWQADGELMEVLAEGVEMAVDAEGRVLLRPLPQWIQAELQTLPRTGG